VLPAGKLAIYNAVQKCEDKKREDVRDKEIYQVIDSNRFASFKNARFEVFTEVLLNIQVFWDVMPCRLVNSYQYLERFLVLLTVHLDTSVYQIQNRCTIYPRFHSSTNLYIIIA